MLKTTTIHSSTMRGINPDKFVPSDARWNRHLPRWLFKEIYILIEFYLDAKERSFEFGDRLFSLIHADERNYHFHLALDGMRSFSGACSSILSQFETVKSFASNGNTYTSSLINPRVTRDVTHKTKTLAAGAISKSLDSVAPAPRLLARIAKRSENPKIDIIRVTSTDFDELQSEPQSTAFIDNLKKVVIPKLSLAHKKALMYNQVLGSLFTRSWGKSKGMLGAEKVALVNESKMNHRSKTIHRFLEISASCNSHWKPVLLMFGSKNSQPALNSLMEMKKMKLAGIVEKLLLVRVRDPALSALQTIKDAGGEATAFVVCQAGRSKDFGSLSGSSFQKFAISHDLFVGKVCVICI
jgi:hypothetical protein